LNRVVIDTNVFVAAAISPTGFCAALMLKRSEGAFETVVSERHLEELRLTLSSAKFAGHITPEDAAAFVSYVERTSITVADPPDPPRVCRDGSDDFLFSLATASGAVAIVSGDKDLVAVDEMPMRVLSPRRFVEALS